MSALGKMGRFGNQVFQYAFLRLCARAAGTDYQCAPWAGQALFGHEDEAVSVALPPLIEAGTQSAAVFDAVPEFIPYVEKISGRRSGRISPAALTAGSPSGDLIGFFQFHTRHMRPHRDAFRSLFQPLDDLRDWVEEPLTVLRERGSTIVVIHLRAGDYRWLPQLGFTLAVPSQWWVDWLDEHWPTLENPVLFLCTDDPAARSAFARFKPILAEDLRVKPPARLGDTGSGFYRDYYVMTQADVLGISNSTFSFSAAMLNERATVFVRPTWDLATRFTRFDPWDAEPLLYQPGAQRGFYKDYGAMLGAAREMAGVRGMLSSALLYHPVGSIIIGGARLALAHRGRGWRGVRDLILARDRMPRER